MSITIVIVNWNSGTQLRDCLLSIARYSGDLVERTVVVDNNSSDGSEMVAEQSASVKLIRAGQNLGFAKACNLGAVDSSTEYLLFLNPDAEIKNGTLFVSNQFMGQPTNSKVAICGVQLRDHRDAVAHSCARFPSARRFVGHSLGLDRLFPGSGLHMTDWDHMQTQKVDHVIGAFFLVRRQVFISLNGFDENFFMYLEDIDFSYRSHKAGWETAYLCETYAFHAGGGTSKNIKATRLFYSLQSQLVYSFKNLASPSAVLVLLVTLSIEPLLRAGLAFKRRSKQEFIEVLVAYKLLWRWLPAWLLKRVPI